jgi:hypothetical protein
LIAEKDKGVPEKKDRPTRRIFKDFARSQHTRVNEQTSHQTIAHQIGIEKFKDSYFFVTNS